MNITLGTKTLNRVVIAIGAILLAVGFASAVEAATKAKTSTGVICTIVGTAGNNTINGTSKNDVICGLGGNDVIKGLAGNDIIDGGLGNDTLYGGTGNDTLIGGGGNDSLRGEVGTDSLAGDTGNDSLLGGDGNDTLRGGDGTDSLTGDAGNDVSYGGSGNDTISGGLGNDTSSGETGNDKLLGGDGVDKLYGNDGVDAILGDAGNDKVYGGAGDDNLSGGTGDDSLLGEVGNDTANGGDGTDSLLGGDGADSLVGGTGNDLVSGDSGNDNLAGGDGNDDLNGGEGDDSASGDLGNDDISGGEGVDSLIGNGGDDSLEGDAGNDAMFGGDGSDDLSGGDGNDRLSGEAGNDDLMGEAGNDGMIGGPGADDLAGANGEPAPLERNLCEKDVNDTVTYCGFDNAAPWIESAVLSRTYVDSSETEQVVEVTLHVTDELMGADIIGCSIMFEEARGSTGYNRAVRTSGDAIDGIYTCNVTIPFGGSTGRWGLNIDTRDRAGNMGFANQGTFGKMHSNLPEIMDQNPEHWIEQTGPGDNQSPRITNLLFSKNEIDTSAGPDSFNLDMTLTDDFSGIKSLQCGLRHNAVENMDINIVASQISGTDLDGVWRCAITLPQNSGQGVWRVAVFVSDKSGKRYSVQGKPDTETIWAVDDISEWTVQPPLDLGKNFITQVGDGDDELPTMTSIILDKTQVNTSSSDQTIVATLNLVDLESGIKSAELRSFSPTTFAQNTAACKFSSKDGAGSEVWTCTLKLPLGSQKGLHSFSIMMFDKMGNRVTYSYNADTGKWRLVPLNFYNYITTENLELGPVGVLNTD
jgi:Ca2+-binding RTX toxin-like protein